MTASQIYLQALLSLETNLLSFNKIHQTFEFGNNFWFYKVSL